MYKNILIPIALEHENDTSDLRAVARKLLADGGQITLLSVVEKIPVHVAEFMVIKPVDQLIEHVKAKLDKAKGNEPDIKTHVASGNAAVTIIEYAKEQSTDLIVVSSHQPGIQDYFVGSTAARIVRHAPCAVHIIRRPEADT